MATPVTSSAPMVVSVAPDRLILERIVSARQLAVHAPSDYGREEDYSTAGLFDPFASTDTFQEFDPVFVDTSSIGAVPSAAENGNGKGHASENGNGNGNGNGHAPGNGNGNGHQGSGNGNGGGIDSYSQTDPAQYAAQQQVPTQSSSIGGFSVTAAPLTEQVHTPFASESAPTLVTASTAAAVESPPQDVQAAIVQQVSPVEQMSSPVVEQVNVAPSQAADLSQLQSAHPVEAAPQPASQLAQQSTQQSHDVNAPPSEIRANDNGSPLPPPGTDEAAENRAVENQAMMQANTVVVAAAHNTESKNADTEQFDPTDESPPQRPKVAAPDFFSNGPSTKPKSQSSENSDGDSPAQAAKPRVVQSGPAFDFFASSSPGGAPVAKSANPTGDELRKTSENKTKAEKNDALSSFENLLAKQSKTGQHNLDTGARAKLKDDDDSEHSSSSRARELNRNGGSKSASARRKELEDEEEEDDNWDAPKNKKGRRHVEEDEEFDDENDNFTARSAKASKKASQTRSLIDKYPAPGKRNQDDDEDDDDEHGSSRSKAKKTKLPAALRSRTDDDDDSDDEDDNEDEQPTRRNFSGGASSARPIKKGVRGASARSGGKGKRRNDDDEEDEPSGIEGTLAKLRESLQGGGLEIAGFPVSIGHVSLGIFIIGLLFFAITHVMGNLANIGSSASAGGAGGGGGAQQAPMMLGKAPSVAGLWAVDVAQDGKSWSGLMNLSQSGNQLNGGGGDKFGKYILTGWMQDTTTIVLKKRYQDINGRDSGPIINLLGTIDLQAVPMKANGTWNFVKKSGTNFGYLNKASATTISGVWRSTLRKSAPATDGGIFPPMQPGPSTLPGQATSPPGNGGFNIIKFAVGNGVWIALFVGVFLIGGSFVLFGPDGLINIWNKQQYIPSQFKSQHGKIRGQLAKSLRKGSLPLGQRVEWKWYFPMPWIVKDLALPPDLRKINPHVLILGQGGKGKTRLIANMITHDVESNDRAVIAIDSDGTLIDLITRWISAHPRGEEMAKRVILIDPTSKSNQASFNPLEMPAKGDIQSAATSIVYGFKAIYSEAPGQQSQWNQQTADILRTSVLLLMANDKTLLDLPALLQDNDFRDIMLESVERRKNERVEFITLLDQWGRYKKLARSDQWITWVEPILNRLNPMLSNPRIRSIFSEADGDLKVTDVIINKRILLVKIPQGEFGQDANLLGSLIVAGIKQAALTLSSVSPKQQQEVALYLDNFDNFIEKETIDNITSETKKFKIGLVGVTKSLQHLQEDFRNQLIINVGTLITFALSKKDGDMLGPQMFPIDGRKVKHQTMSNIFNRVNTSPQFELVSDEEKLNIDKIVRQEERTFFCYKMGAEAGLFNLKAHPFDDIPNSRVKKKLIQKMHRSSTASKNSGRDTGKDTGKLSAKTSSRNDDDDDD